MEVNPESGAAGESVAEFRAGAIDTDLPVAKTETQTAEKELSKVEITYKEVTDAIVHAERVPGYKPERPTQKKVIDSWVKDSGGLEGLLLELRGHLYSASLEDKFYTRIRGESGKPFNNHAALRGELAEKLAEHDSTILERTPQTEEFLAFNHNPERFKPNGRITYEEASAFREVAGVRNPDAVRVVPTEHGGWIIEEIGEVTTVEKLGRRKALQLTGGIRRGTGRVAGFLNKMKDRLEDYGLTNLAEVMGTGKEGKADKFMRVSNHFKTTLIVPADRNTNPDVFIDEEELKSDPNLRDELREQLETGKIEVKKMRFSTKEIDALTKLFLPKIYEMEKDNPRFKHEVMPAAPVRSGITEK